MSTTLIVLVPLLVAVYVWIVRRKQKLAMRYASLSMVRDDWARLLPHDHRVAEVAAASRPGRRGRRSCMRLLR